MRNKIFIIFGFILFIFCFIVFYKGLQKPNVYSPELNQKKSISSFVSLDFYSNEKVLSDDIFKKGNYYLVNIWSSWCVPCRSEHPFLIRLKNSKVTSVKKEIGDLIYSYDLKKILVEKFSECFSAKLIK